MGNCIKDVCAYELIKKCSNCRKISLKSKFHRDSKEYDVLTPHCKPGPKLYGKKYCNEHYIIESSRRRKYGIENRD